MYMYICIYTQRMYIDTHMLHMHRYHPKTPFWCKVSGGKWIAVERSIGLMIPEIQLLKEDAVLWWTTPGELISLQTKTCGNLGIYLKPIEKNNRKKEYGKQVQYVRL